MSSTVHELILPVTQPSDGITSDTSSTEQMTATLKLMDQLYVALYFIINPTIGVVGLISNMFGLVVLVKDGLYKSSTTLMLSLTIADSMCLVGAVSPASLLVYTIQEGFTSSFAGWSYPHDIAFFVFILWHILAFCANLGLYVSLTLPPVISIERCIAVYFPLKFKQIMTGRTAKVAVLIVNVIWMPWLVFYSACITFTYTPYGTGLYTLTLYCYTHREEITIVNYYIFNYLTSVCPLIIVVTAAVLITVKIQLTVRKRKKISTNQNLSVQRTTKTLVIVSLINTLVNFVYFLVATLLTDQMSSNPKLNYLVVQGLSAMLYIGNASNIYVCIFLNKKYTSMLFKLLGLKKKHD